MSILGIVAEYNPFHAGHLYHLLQSRETVQPEITVTVLSGSFVQRGVPAMFSTAVRTECALRCGADAVFSLPAFFTLQDADRYALGAVSVLQRLGATHLAFGCESSDTEKLREIAEMTDSTVQAGTDALFHDELHRLLKHGIGYPAAQAKAAEACIPGAAEILSRPNNILAVSYLKAIRQLKTDMQPVFIRRTGDYHGIAVRPDAPSASAIREALRRGDWSVLDSGAVPEESARLIRKAILNGSLPDTEMLYPLLRMRLLQPEVSEISWPNDGEGLIRALRNAAIHCESFDRLIRTVTGKRYSAARIRRLCWQVMLDITQEKVRTETLPSFTRLLGYRAENNALPGMLLGNSGIPVITHGSAMKNSSVQMHTELLADELWYLSAHYPADTAFRQKVIRI